MAQVGVKAMVELTVAIEVAWAAGLDQQAAQPHRSQLGRDRLRRRREWVRGTVTGLGQHAQQRRETRHVIADPSAATTCPSPSMTATVMMVSGPIDSTKPGQGVITPSLRASTVTGGLTRCPNRRTLRSVISLAVRDSSTPQDFALSKSSRLGNNHHEVNPAADSGNGDPTTTGQDPPPGAFFPQASNAGSSQASPGGRPIRNSPVNSTGEPIPTRRLGPCASDGWCI